jgi:protein-L-isoaspartate(D-aspartate) O-methyltransferase
VLGRLAAAVVAAEDDAALAAEARRILADIRAGNVSVVEGALDRAGKAQGPYDVIVVEGTMADVPAGLFDQLKPEGRLVASIGAPGKVPVANLFGKSGKGIAARAEFDARLPPLMQVKDDSFVF